MPSFTGSDLEAVENIAGVAQLGARAADGVCMNNDPLLDELWLVALIATTIGTPPVLPQRLIDELTWEAKINVLLGVSPLN